MSNKGKGNKGPKQPAAAQAAPVENVSHLTPSTPTPAPQPEAPKPALVVDNTQPKLALKAAAFWLALTGALTTEAHALAVECLDHASKHGDLRPLLAYQNAMPRSTRKVEFMAWCAEFAPVKWGKRDPSDNADGIKQLTENEKGFKPYDIPGATERPFYMKAEATKAKGIRDFITQMTAEVKGYQKLIDEPTLPRKGNISDAEILDAIAQRKLAMSAVLVKQSNVA